MVIIEVWGDNWAAICFSVNAVRVLGPPCEHTAGRWIRGHALSASRPAIYNPFPLRLMTWSEQVEIMQITFPWKSLSLDPVRGVSLRARVPMFVFTSEGGACPWKWWDCSWGPGWNSIFFLWHIFPDWLYWLSCTGHVTRPCCGMWQGVRMCLFTCTLTDTYTCSPAKAQWINKVAVGEESERFHLLRWLFSSPFAAHWMSVLDAVLQPSHR